MPTSPKQTKLLKFKDSLGIPKDKPQQEPDVTKNKYPPLACPACNGNGKGYAFRDRDVIEGYKMASKHTCLLCDGNGIFYPTSSRYLGVAAYIKAMSKAKKDEDDARQRREADRAKLVKAAKDKLTKEEMQALGIKL